MRTSIASGAARTLIERAYAQLRDDIIEGSLAPGEKLRVEHLKTRYQVGAGTLREAITRAVDKVYADGIKPFEFGGRNGTADVAKAVLAAL